MATCIDTPAPPSLQSSQFPLSSSLPKKFSSPYMRFLQPLHLDLSSKYSHCPLFKLGCISQEYEAKAASAVVWMSSSSTINFLILGTKTCDSVGVFLLFNSFEKTDGWLIASSSWTADVFVWSCEFSAVLKSSETRSGCCSMVIFSFFTENGRTKRTYRAS